MDYEGENAKRLVLKSHVGRDVVDRLARDCHGMIWWDLFEADGDQPYEKVWILPPHDTTSLHYIEDTYANANYLLVQGEEVEKVEDCFRRANVILEVSKCMDCYHSADAPNEAVDALVKACLVASRTDHSEITKILADAFERRDAAIREAALVGVAYLEWESLIPLLRTVEETDEDQSIREVAGELATFMEYKS